MGGALFSSNGTHAAGKGGCAGTHLDELLMYQIVGESEEAANQDVDDEETAHLRWPRLGVWWAPSRKLGQFSDPTSGNTRGGLLKPSESGSHVWAWLWERLFPSNRHRTWGLDSSPNHSMRGCSSRHRAKISLPQEERGWFSLSNNYAAAHSSFGKVGALGSSDVCGWESKRSARGGDARRARAEKHAQRVQGLLAHLQQDA